MQRTFDDLGTPLSDVTFCVIDLETTGGDRNNDYITEIGAIKMRGAYRPLLVLSMLHAEFLVAEQAKISIAGSGDVKAHATGSADVSIMGSGDVEVSGGAKCKVSKAGSGDVRCS